MYILDCEINIVSNSTKYSSNQDYSFPLSYQDGELLWTGTQQELLGLPLPFIKRDYHVRQPQGAFHRDRPCLVFSFHITINDVYVKKTRMLDRSTAVTPFLDKLKKKPMSKSSKDTCDRERRPVRTRKSESFFSVCKISTGYFSVDYIFILFTKNFLIFPERHPEKCTFQ